MTEAPQLEPRTFGIISAALALDPELGKVALRVGMLMACHADKKRRCWLAAETMAKLLQLPRSSVTKALGELVARGHATRQRRSTPGRGMTSSIYTLVYRAEAPTEIPPVGDRAEPDEETATPLPEAPGEPLNQSAGLDSDLRPPAPGDRDLRPPASGDRDLRPPASDPVAAFSGAGGRFSGGPVAAICGHDQYLNSKRDQYDEEDAHAREASAASPPDVSVEDQARMIFDDMAQRAGLPMAGALTGRERKLLTARLQQCEAFEGGWPGFVDRIERSNFLTGKLKPRPGLKWFLDEDHFAATARGDYDAEQDPPLRGVAAMMAGLHAAGMRDTDSPAPSAPEPETPTPQPPAQPPPDPLALNLSVIARYTGKTTVEIEALAARWLADLEAAGFDPASAHEILTDEAKRVPKSGYAIQGMNERVAARLKAVAA